MNLVLTPNRISRVETVTSRTARLHADLGVPFGYRGTDPFPPHKTRNSTWDVIERYLRGDIKPTPILVPINEETQVAEIPGFPDFGLTESGQLFRISTKNELSLDRTEKGTFHKLGTCERHYISDLIELVFTKLPAKLYSVPEYTNIHVNIDGQVYEGERRLKPAKIGKILAVKPSEYPDGLSVAFLILQTFIGSKPPFQPETRGYQSDNVVSEACCWIPGHYNKDFTDCSLWNLYWRRYRQRGPNCYDFKEMKALVANLIP